MSKIHPQHLSTPSQTQLVCDQPSICYGHPLSISSSTLSSSSIQGEIFTIWMKSLILGGKGCTVFDSKGQVVYRVDNYSSKCCDQVYLMDSHGHVLLTILRKKFRLLASWKGYKDEKKKGASWWFQVKKSWKFPKMPLECEVVVNLYHDRKSPAFKIEKGKSDLTSCKIVDRLGGLIAEVTRKQSFGGVVLGNDVLTLVIEPNIDPSLIMGVMVAYNLINSKM
ncbi:protein LURP-one-related 11-like [Amaranthus tricolor]|uniref:protein LURP-one-related 11-like n=1 Tax=Amaranthus tricolor TaxID=29722 RepID=UPI002588A567|nr:protein LURP-one-related 11-like [Amaranthus tricolor]